MMGLCDGTCLHFSLQTCWHRTVNEMPACPIQWQPLLFVVPVVIKNSVSALQDAVNNLLGRQMCCGVTRNVMHRKSVRRIFKDKMPFQKRTKLAVYTCTLLQGCTHTSSAHLFRDLRGLHCS